MEMEKSPAARLGHDFPVRHRTVNTIVYVLGGSKYIPATCTVSMELIFTYVVLVPMEIKNNFF
jgi:hypothetical protein